MKETKLYTCEFCGKSYDEKSKCQQCEENHSRPVKIIGATYVPFKNNDDESGYPKRVIIEMEDGGQVEYSRY